MTTLLQSNQNIKSIKLPQPHYQTEIDNLGNAFKLKFRGDEMNLCHSGPGHFECKCQVCKVDSKPIHIHPVEEHKIDRTLKELGKD